MRGERLAPGQRGQINTTKVAPGKWKAQARYRTYSGVIKKVQRSGPSEAQATRKLILATSAIDSMGTKTIKELLVEWIKRHDGVAPATRERYQGVIRNYLTPAVGGVLVGELSTPIVETAVRNIYVDFSRHASERSLKVLRMACKRGVRMSLLERDFTAEVPTPGRVVRARPWVPSGEQIDLLLTLLQADYEVPGRLGPRSPSAWLAAEIMVKTGARIGEVCAARWEDVDWAAGTLTLRDTVVFEDGKNSLRGHLKNGDPFRVLYFCQSSVAHCKHMPHRRRYNALKPRESSQEI